MNNDIAIRIEGLGKRYNLGETVDLSRTFRETLMTLPRFFGQKAAELGRQAALRMERRSRLSHLQGLSDTETDPETPHGTFWALRDINFEVKQGEVVGVIGRNGAGKSTLLKILSHITEPTSGRVEIRGRVGSLLEVGTGFNPELTGRENVYLNGSILGMTKKEIDRKFDQIVDFAGVGKFIDTPIKRYSSGMTVRLGFAVAAHLDLEILIVDEVLAVGDAAFQRKCLGKMNEVVTQGRTVLFVSHNMGMINELCPRCVLLRDGLVTADDKTEEIIKQYLSSFKADIDTIYNSRVFETNSQLPMQLTSAKLLDDKDHISDTFDILGSIIIEIEYIVRKQMVDSIIGIAVNYGPETIFLSWDTDFFSSPSRMREMGQYKARLKLPSPLLKSGDYQVTISIGVPNGTTIHQENNCLQFQIIEASESSSLRSYSSRRAGRLVVPIKWDISRL